MSVAMYPGVNSDDECALRSKFDADTIRHREFRGLRDTVRAADGYSDPANDGQDIDDDATPFAARTGANARHMASVPR
jgi:hypothetical protein